LFFILQGSLFFSPFPQIVSGFVPFSRLLPPARPTLVKCFYIVEPAPRAFLSHGTQFFLPCSVIVVSAFLFPQNPFPSTRPFCSSTFLVLVLFWHLFPCQSPSLIFVTPLPVPSPPCCLLRDSSPIPSPTGFPFFFFPCPIFFRSPNISLFLVFSSFVHPPLLRHCGAPLG